MRQPGAARTQEIDLAINAVLAAEHAARAAVVACREQAGRLLEEAAERERGVAARAERRIKQAHRIADAAVDRRLRQLAEQTPDPEAARADQILEGAWIDAALDGLVEEILGSRP